MDKEECPKPGPILKENGILCELSGLEEEIIRPESFRYLGRLRKRRDTNLDRDWIQRLS
jgi:hypothetical protein